MSQSKASKQFSYRSKNVDPSSKHIRNGADVIVLPLYLQVRPFLGPPDISRTLISTSVVHPGSGLRPLIMESSSTGKASEVIMDPSVGIESLYANKKLERHIIDTKKELTKNMLIENYHIQYNNFKVNNNSDQSNTGLYKSALKKDQRIRLGLSSANTVHNPLRVRNTESRTVG
jgi:hypothetical protein